MQKWDNRACSDCTWINPTRTRIVRLQALDFVASLNSAKAFPCLFDSPCSHSPKNLYPSSLPRLSLCSSSIPLYFSFQSQPPPSLLLPSMFSTSSTAHSSTKSLSLNHHHVEVVMSLPHVSCSLLWTLVEVVPHSSKWKQKQKKKTHSPGPKRVYNIILRYFYFYLKMCVNVLFYCLL